MGTYRPLRGILLVYELIRLAALISAIGRTAPAGEGVVFPALVYGGANALFLLMALFVWLDPLRYEVYVPLYTAGKVISVVSALGWCFFSLERFFNAAFTHDSGIFITLGLLLCITLGDILSACGGAALSRKLSKLRRMEVFAGTAIAGTAIAETTAAEPEAANSDDL
jgi:hypothetical protein